MNTMPLFSTHIEFYFCRVPGFKVYKVHADVVSRLVTVYKRSRIGWKDFYDIVVEYYDCDCLNAEQAEKILTGLNL